MPFGAVHNPCLCKMGSPETGLPNKLEFANPLTNGLPFHNKLYNIKIQVGLAKKQRQTEFDYSATDSSTTLTIMINKMTRQTKRGFACPFGFHLSLPRR